MSLFKLVSEYAPGGDQPEAIAALVKGLREGTRYQTLQGVTGSGKTFTLANVIAQMDRPVLVLSHNKTLAAQLYSEFKAFFPENAGSISSAITIIICRSPIFRRRTPTLRRTPASTRTLNGCVFPRRRR